MCLVALRKTTNTKCPDLYTGMELSVVPIFQSEITPKAARGFVVGTYQLCLTVRFPLIPENRGTMEKH